MNDTKSHSKIIDAYARGRPLFDYLLGVGARCMEETTDKAGIVWQRWLLPSNGLSVVAFSTPDWCDVFAPVTGSGRVDITLDALKRLAARPAGRVPRAQFTMKTIDVTAAGMPATDVLLRDNDNGSMTITNDAEAVCAYVNSCFPGRRIFYIDTMGRCDELVHDDGRFVTFANAAGRYL